MKAAELRDMDVEALRARTQELDDQLFRMRIQKSMGQLEAPGKMRTIKRDRARILTILKEKAK
jgi:large subunit ribosomal protein L29